jgi:AraC family transcriptional regulator, transcriptional activator of pobA
MKEHTHEHHELLIFQKGHQFARVSGEELVAGPGEVLFYPAGTPHEEWLAPEETVVKFTIGFAWNIDLGDVPSRITDTCGRLIELAEWISSEVPNRGDLNPALPEPLLHGMIGELRRAAQRSGNELRNRAYRVVQQNMSEICSVESLAKRLDMSRSYFCRKFIQETGELPSEFLRQQRLQRAHSLLRNTSMGVKEIAARVGVSSEQQLCRMIRVDSGLTTRKIRGELALIKHS